MVTSFKLSVDPSQPRDRHPTNIDGFLDVLKPPKIPDIPKKLVPCEVQLLEIRVEDGPDGTVVGFLHLPRNRTQAVKAATILLSGAGEGVVGPASIYLHIHGRKNSILLSSYPYASPQLSFSHYMPRSFGGAPVFTVGGADRRVVGCATVASQTAETDGIRNLAPTPVLLLHGTGDQTLSSICSKRLYEAYGACKGKRRLKLFDEDNHALTEKAENMLVHFITSWATVPMEDDDEDLLHKEFIEDKDKVELVKRGGDLSGKESIN
ncbi:hypothetical protein CVT26_015490 [Gymnopilus dilepis]|uniref:Uncharacterized protein n=1 Tax=Gymnopilus dilepis TaxID=231916 RepID=A0A409W4G5_9AGAR|nr:hypothetical protein CVT26_015490 [Gymnopilus dilepis]